MTQEETKAVELPEEGTVLETSDGKVKLVHDKDEEGNVVGWHKEPLDTDKHPVDDGDGKEVTLAKEEK